MIDTRRYQWVVGAIGLLLVAAFSIHLLGHGARATVGVPAGQRLHRFVAPLATASIDADANVAPRCDPRRPARQGLNVCGRTALVLAFFAPGATSCVRSVNALNALSPPAGVTYAAVAIGADRAAARRLIRRNRWTLPVAYDPSGAVAALYDVTVCPLIEVARAGGVVTRRLIGDHWSARAALARVLGSGSSAASGTLAPPTTGRTTRKPAAAAARPAGAAPLGGASQAAGAVR